MVQIASALLAIAALVIAGCDRTPPADAAREVPIEVASEVMGELTGETVDGGQQPIPAPALPDVDRRLGISADAKLDTLAMLLDDLAAPRHPSDGGGRAWVEAIEDASGPASSLRVGSRGRIHLRYEAGPLGVDVGGVIYFQVSPFWGWDPPQDIEETGRGYTTARSLAEGVQIQSRWLGAELFGIEVQGRRLEAGEQLEVVYGAGPAFASVDRFAEHEARLWFGVDGDGDGVRKLIASPPTVDILAGRPARLQLMLPSSARPGEKVRLDLSVLDRSGSMGPPYAGEVLLSASGAAEVPGRVRFAPEHGGRRSLEVRVTAAGVVRIDARAADDDLLEATSNPLVVREGIPRLRWTDLHGHSQLSDGTGTPDDYFRYARDVAGLDVVALTDHDHWGMQFLDATPSMWSRIRDTVKEFHEPNRFVTLLGYEWTSWVHGHRHVIYFDDAGDVLSTLDPRYETPAQLWQGLAGTRALTFAHHSAGGPVATNWAYVPPPEIEPVTEIVSVHGSSEAMDSPGPIYSPVPGNFVRDVLDRGARFGFIGSGDSHDGHPGLSHIASPGGGGLAAIFSEDLTREGIREALLARRVYASNGARIWLEVDLDGHGMGSAIAERADAATQHLRVSAVAESAIERIDIIRSGAISPIAIDGALEATIERDIPPLRRGEYHYVRVVQEDGGAVWSSPIYVD